MGSEFPVDGIVPRKSTKAFEFVEQRPKCNGDGILVAVLDTGVDPGSAGLQETPCGKPKIVGLLDTSGGGDVALKETTITSEGQVELLSGKKIRVLEEVKDGKVYVGRKPIFEFFPKLLVERLKTERKEKFKFDHAKYMASVMADLDKFPASGTADRNTLLERNDLKVRLEILENLLKSYEDPGPTVDCIAFKNLDEKWMGALVKTEESEMNCILPAIDRTYGSAAYAKWDDESQLNYAIHVNDEGRSLTIVVPGSHGTHVASIIAGYHKDEPEFNGVAPGAQLLSIKIGDERINSMETGASLIRALNVCVEWGVDIINLSFGEPTTLPEGGRVIQLFRELVDKTGIIFCTSNGNAGPALSTVGAPATDSLSSVISVGAFVEPSLMLAAYAIHESEMPPASMYTWSSRGPSYDGGMAPSVVAPGGAICSLPQFTLVRRRLMNGTSMSSPHVSGCVALMLSAANADGIRYSPPSVKRALMNTAVNVPVTDLCEQGAGLINVIDAYDCLERQSHVHWHFPVQVNITNSEARTNTGACRGIYIREPWEASPRSRRYSVQVSFLYPSDEISFIAKDKVRQRYVYRQADRNTISVQIRLESSHPWITTVEHLFLSSTTSTFSIVVNLGGIMPSQTFYCGQVLGFDPLNEDIGPLFRIPVTVVRPVACPTLACNTHFESEASSVELMRHEPSLLFDTLGFTPGKIIREFVVVPPGATWMDVSIAPSLNGAPHSIIPGSSRVFYLHCLQMHQQSHYKADELKTTLRIRQEPGSQIVRSMPVTEGGTVEVCLAQYWSSIGEGNISMNVTFSGVTPVPNVVALSPNQAEIAKVTLTAKLSMIRISPSAKLKTWTRCVRPSSSKISCLVNSERDFILAQKSRPCFALEMEYVLKNLEEGKCTIKFPLLDNVLYDSAFDSQMIMIFDSKSKLLWVSDAWAKTFTMPKGEFTARIMIRHERKSLLENIDDMPLIWERSLGSEISLLVNKTYEGACKSATDAFPAKILEVGESMVLFISPPSWKDISKKLPKGAQPGDILIGTVDYSRRPGSNVNATGSDKRPKGYQVEMIISTQNSTKNDSGPSLVEKNKVNDKEKTLYDYLMLPRIREKTKLLSDLKDKNGPIHDEVFEIALSTGRELVLEGLEKYPCFETELNRFLAQIARMELYRYVRGNAEALTVENMEQTQYDAVRSHILALCDEIIRLCNVPDLNVKFKNGADIDGVTVSERNKTLTKRNSDYRSWLTEAYVIQQYASGFTVDNSEQLQLVSEAKDLLLSQLAMHRHLKFCRYGSALANLEKLLECPPAEPSILPFSEAEAEKLKKSLLLKLGWDAIHKIYAEAMEMRRVFDSYTF